MLKRFSAVKKPLSIALMLFLAVLAGCQKENGPGAGSQEDPNTIKYVLNDNFNFSVVTFALQQTGLRDTLAQKGPYTFLAPDNPAFNLINVVDPPTVNTFYYLGIQHVRDILHYCILPEGISFKALPIDMTNRAFPTLTGGNVYITKYLNGTDTIITVNGQKLRAADNAASNGFIQVLPQVINPELYPTMAGHIHNDTLLTFFSAAMQRANLDVALLEGGEAYTVLAPTNSAFRQSGSLGLSLDVSSIDAILHCDPAQLAALLQYHILKGRYFQGDLFHLTAGDPSSITMLNGEKVVIGGNPAGFHAITFTGRGNTGPSNIYVPFGYNPAANNTDYPCGNGVIHYIDQVLVP